MQTVTTEDIKFLADMFKDLDLDNSGYRSRNELRKNLLDHMSSDAQKFLNDYLAHLDGDQDGRISFRELVETLYPGLFFCVYSSTVITVVSF